jgi:CubicO group peptidase (beta-lactamase class C family)
METTVPTHTLPRTTPEQQGIASSRVLEFVRALENQVNEIHSFMLLRHGCVVAEGWWSPYAPEHPHMLFSLSKSFTSTGVGLAVAEGYFSIDDPVLSFFPDETPRIMNDFVKTMQVKHLLSMSTGQAEDTWSFMVNRADGDWIKGFFSVPVRYAPGTVFVYNTGATYMLSAIVQKTTGLKLLDYLEPRLLKPLGIEHATWQESPQGITAGGIGMSAKTEDIARFGQLYLQKGRWQGEQLLSEAWLEAATTSQVSNSDGMQLDWKQGYGYQFWRCRHGAYRGDGVFGQYCIVMPEQDAVLAITGGVDVFDMQTPLNLLWEILLPAMQPGSLPDDLAAHNTLAMKLSSLSFTPVQGQATSPLASQISGRAYAVDPNEADIETITMNFNDSGCTINVKTSLNEEVIPCGYNAWQPGQKTALFRQPLLFHETPITTSGAWTSEDTFRMVIRLYETPFYHTLDYHFAGVELIVESRINTSLESLEPLLLTGHSL